MVTVGIIRGVLGHEVNGDRPPRACAVVRAGAMPGQGMVEVNMTLFDRAHHEMNRLTFKGFRQVTAFGKAIDLGLFIAPFVGARYHVHTAVIRFRII